MINNAIQAANFFYISIFNIIIDNFNQYDYGPEMNLNYYKSTTPPLYNLKSNQVPTTLFYGDNDLISNVKVSYLQPHFANTLYYNIYFILSINLAGCSYT